MFTGMPTPQEPPKRPAPCGISDALDNTTFVSLSLCPGRDGLWQANMQTERGGGWRVCHGATPSEALGAVFAPVPSDVPASLLPLPY